MGLGADECPITLIQHSNQGCPRTPVYCVPRTARRRGCLRTASTPDVPDCAAGWMAMAVVLARCSAPGRVCSMAGSRTVDGAHRFGCRLRICVLWGHAWRCPCFLELHAPNGTYAAAEGRLFPSWLRMARVTGRCFQEGSSIEKKNCLPLLLRTRRPLRRYPSMRSMSSQGINT